MLSKAFGKMYKASQIKGLSDKADINRGLKGSRNSQGDFIPQSLEEAFDNPKPMREALDGNGEVQVYIESVKKDIDELNKEIELTTDEVELSALKAEREALIQEFYAVLEDSQVATPMEIRNMLDSLLER